MEILPPFGHEQVSPQPPFPDLPALVSASDVQRSRFLAFKIRSKILSGNGRLIIQADVLPADLIYEKDNQRLSVPHMSPGGPTTQTSSLPREAPGTFC